MEHHVNCKLNLMKFALMNHTYVVLHVYLKLSRCQTINKTLPITIEYVLVVGIERN